MHRNKRSLVVIVDSIDKRLNKTSSGDKNLRQQTRLLTGLREQIRTLDVKIVDEEASLGDAKRDKAREWTGDLLDGLLECSATGAVVAASARTIIECVPTDPTQPGLPRVHYSGHSQVELLVAEAEQTIRKISTVGEVDVSFGSEAGFSLISEVGDETSQPPNRLGVGNIPGNPSSTLSLPIQPIQYYASSTLPNNRPSDPHELKDFRDHHHNPHSQSPTYVPRQWPRLYPPDEPSPANPVGPSVLTPSHPPRPLDLTRDILGLSSSSSSSGIRPTSTHQLIQKFIAIEEQIILDAEITKHLQDADGAGDIYTDEVQDANWYVTGISYFHLEAQTVAYQDVWPENIGPLRLLLLWHVGLLNIIYRRRARAVRIKGMSQWKSHPPSPGISDVFSPITAISENTEMWSNGKGKAREEEEPLPGTFLSFSPPFT